MEDKRRRRKRRQQMILELVRSYEIQTQEELCDRLTGVGFEATQATVSRDIKELALIKTKSSSGNAIYSVSGLKREAISGGDNMAISIISDSVLSVDYAMNTVVVKCASGMAQAVCAKLDSTGLYGAVGTIAGDDTIFVLMRSQKDAQRLVIELNAIIAAE